MNRRLTKVSKYLTFILRHHPEAIGMQLEEGGWLPVDDLVKNANAHGKSISSDQVFEVVAQSEDQLFDLSDDRLRIRAR